MKYLVLCIRNISPFLSTLWKVKTWRTLFRLVLKKTFRLRTTGFETSNNKIMALSRLYYSLNHWSKLQMVSKCKVVSRICVLCYRKKYLLRNIDELKKEITTSSRSLKRANSAMFGTGSTRACAWGAHNILNALS